LVYVHVESQWNERKEDAYRPNKSWRRREGEGSVMEQSLERQGNQKNLSREERGRRRRTERRGGEREEEEEDDSSARGCRFKEGWMWGVVTPSYHEKTTSFPECISTERCK
jgi:hypothetical protein